MTQCATHSLVINRPARTLQEERVVHIAARVRLRLEQRVEVPERRLHEAICGHLLEPAHAGTHKHTNHANDTPRTKRSKPIGCVPQRARLSPNLKQDLTQLRTHAEQRVQAAASHGPPERIEIVGLELLSAPRAAAARRQAVAFAGSTPTHTTPGARARAHTCQASLASAPPPPLCAKAQTWDPSQAGRTSCACDGTRGEVCSNHGGTQPAAPAAAAATRTQSQSAAAF